MATRLEGLEIDELSGVEDPANELPGWIVQKGIVKDGEVDVDALQKEVNRAESDFAILYSALQSSQQYITDAPPEVAAAFDTLTQYIEGLFQDSGNSPPDAQLAAPAPTPVQASKGGILARLLRKDGAADETVEKSEDDESEDEETDEEYESPEEDSELVGGSSTLADDQVEHDARAQVDDIKKSVTEAVTASLDPVIETQEVLKTAVEGLANRLGNMEARQTGHRPEETTDETVEKTQASRSTIAFGSAIKDLRAGGRGVTLT